MYISRRIRLLLAFISLLYSIFLIQSTYAKYKSEATAISNFTIARWNISVNNQDIKNNKDFSNKIKPVFLGNQNIAPNVVAPLSEGYFDVVIDASNVDVSFNYNIKIKKNTSNKIEDLKITHYTLNSSGNVVLTDNNYVVTNTINYNETNKIKTYRFFIKWIDDENQTMNNIEDTKITNKQNTTLNINIDFVQIK